MDEYNNNMNPNPNGTPEPPSQPDYAGQYNQQPDYANQPQQPDYSQQYNQQPDYANQPQQPDYSQQYNQQPDYTNQPQQPDYSQQYNQQPDYTNQPQQPDYSQQYNQQPDYSQQFNQYNQANGDYSNQPYQPQPMGGYNNAPVEGPVGAAKAFSIVSLVCGILSLAFGLLPCTYYLGLVFGIPAIVFAIIAKKKFTGRNVMPTLGLVFGIIGSAVCLIYICVICVMAVSGGISSGIRNFR